MNIGVRHAPSDEKKMASSRGRLLSHFFNFFFKWWPMQRGEMTSQLDLHFTL